ncbi:vacuolar fusion protein MON1, putative [Plasmodium berghei]|uniref:Vacuolar fusion protein MON1, putative n=3 Tax=Plasmodium berghei TaxID=5821 RepID=A0A509ARQ3_PLABA|nr:vacuolar fusion protein MON1, putative [Plasmodium berghei ANKA]CXJ06049.1 vacuolar fusion protein MON1, putative [Plasmodium berghei]SCM18725.1 vacuolar fusion protein MON1, putative [Plasmodium berghei]SCN28161.1 vacuolar fusion protein MON1, putative [Plasmodium berghei]VUC58041.1 vacuolar fusion protein MON1, putative [Plasmodium berghei ANKA]|eukprot:XP_034423810.1 vacuolar fusion protein MON1, putative [Plasmodium berghei ANKA]
MHDDDENEKHESKDISQYNYKNIVDKNKNNGKDIMDYSFYEENYILNNDDINYYDAKVINESDDNFENCFGVNKESYKELSKRDEYKLGIYDDIINSNTDDDLEDFFEDRKSEKKGINNNHKYPQTNVFGDEVDKNDTNKLHTRDNSSITLKEEHCFIEKGEYEENDKHNNKHDLNLINNDAYNTGTMYYDNKKVSSENNDLENMIKNENLILNNEMIDPTNIRKKSNDNLFVDINSDEKNFEEDNSADRILEEGGIKKETKKICDNLIENLSGHIKEKVNDKSNEEGKNKKSDKTETLNKFDGSNNDSPNNSKFLLEKKKIHEDQTNPLWYKHKRHFFIFTYSGKPVFTRYGNEENLTSFYGTLLAIISKIGSFSFCSDTSTDNNNNNNKTTDIHGKNSLKYIVSKNTKIVYLDKEVLCLICISSVNESNNYILNILNYMYLQIISLLTKSIEKSFRIKPSFDVRYLLDGADLLTCNMISSYSKNMYSIFDGFEPLPLKQEYRNQIHNLISSFKISNVLLSFLFINDKIIGISVSKYTISSIDIVILINMITSMKSFKNAESWIPICLPIYNPNQFLYAYINCIKNKIFCVYICSGASSQDFFHLSSHTSMIETTLTSSGCYEEIIKASNTSSFELPDIPGIDIIHMCYYIPYLKQYYSTKICSNKIKKKIRAYQKCDDIIKDSKLPAQIYMETEYENFYFIKTNLYYLYLSVPFYVNINEESINEILKVISKYHKEIFINNIKQISS